MTPRTRTDSRKAPVRLLVLAVTISALALGLTGAIAFAGVPGALPAAGRLQAQRQITPQTSTYAQAGRQSLGSPLAPAVVLYDQYNNPGTNAASSQDFESAYDAYDDQVADDFAIPAGQSWQVNEVDVQGIYYNGTGPADGFNVYFYENSGTLPGTPVYTATNQTYTVSNGVDFAVTLSAPATLNSGASYWVSVQARMDATTGGQWGWQNRLVISNNPSVWRNPGNGFNTGCTAWSVKTSCIPNSGPDNVFRLVGDYVTGGTATVTAVATSSATAQVSATSTAQASATTTAQPSATTTAQASATRTAVSTGTAQPSTTATEQVSATTTAQASATETEVSTTATPQASVTGTPQASATVTAGATATAFVCNGWVTICHRTGNGDSHTITVSCNALPAHLRHGDTIGACQGEPGPRHNPFSDVHESDYFYSTVLDLSEMGAIGGYRDGTFRPYNTTTRSQLVKIVVLAFNIPLYRGNAQHFSDVPRSDPFYVYVETAREAGILGGYSDGTFRPYNNVTRGQLAKMIVGAAGMQDLSGNTPSFTDVPVGSTFYRYIETAYANGILNGYADHSFRPNNDATRGQASKIVDLATSSR